MDVTTRPKIVISKKRKNRTTSRGEINQKAGRNERNKNVGIVTIFQKKKRKIKKGREDVVMLEEEREGR